MILVIGDFTDILIHQSVGGVIFLKKGGYLPAREAGWGNYRGKPGRVF